MQRKRRAQEPLQETKTPKNEQQLDAIKEKYDKMRLIWREKETSMDIS